ncbi:MAG: hypothetical protein IKY99_06320, partial [Bacteroidaceae bacterium]|nr:hypothetical protein [Bacteroidaceae bacterium]
MKKNILIIIALIALSVGTVYSNGNVKSGVVDDSTLYENALKAIDDGKFVIKANTLTLKQGRSGNVDSESNFVV